MTADVDFAVREILLMWGEFDMRRTLYGSVLTLVLASLLRADPVLAGTLLVTGGGSCPGARVDGFTVRKTINSIAPCYLDFTYSDTPEFTGATVDLREDVTNDSGIPWHDFHFILGFVDDHAQFIPSDNNDGLHFDLDTDGPRSPQFVLLPGSLSGGDRGPDQLDFKVPGFDIPPDVLVSFFFGLRLSDNDDVGHGGTFDDGIVRFTLLQIPTVPEPASLALLALGLGILGYSRRKRVS